MADSPELIMEARLAALKLMLDAMGIPSTVATMAARKSMQKGVYLGQCAGVDLGYRFGWYIKGPYSPALANAYYELNESLASGETPGRNLRNDLRQRLAPVRNALRLPEDVGLSNDDWLELLASLHYLMQVRRLDIEAAGEVIRTKKNRLFPYVDEAHTALQAAHLL
jgi:uncharacterized protein YwgA